MPTPELEDLLNTLDDEKDDALKALKQAIKGNDEMEISKKSLSFILTWTTYSRVADYVNDLNDDDDDDDIRVRIIAHNKNTKDIFEISPDQVKHVLDLCSDGKNEEAKEFLDNLGKKGSDAESQETSGPVFGAKEMKHVFDLLAEKDCEGAEKYLDDIQKKLEKRIAKALKRRGALVEKIREEIADLEKKDHLTDSEKDRLELLKTALAIANSAKF